jgi:hypothetical protein
LAWSALPAAGSWGDEGTALLRRLHFVCRLRAQAASLWAFVLCGGLAASLSSLALVTDERGGRMAWEEGLGYGIRYNRSGRWGAREGGGEPAQQHAEGSRGAPGGCT